MLGTCDPSYTYDVLTRAVELLANKPTKTNVVWDPLICYVDLPVVNGYYVCLPPHVLKPIKINLNKQPAFTRNQFFEFSMNGPGSLDPEAGWSWQDRGWRALQKPWPQGGAPYIIMSTSSADLNTVVKLNTLRQDGSTSWLDCFIGQPYTTKIYGILEASKPTTQGTLSLYANSFILDSALVAQWAPDVHYPQFEWIKLSQNAVACKMLCRRRTYKLTQPTDVIPLSNRQAIIVACLAIKAYDTLNWDDGATAEQNALRFLEEDQGARNLFQRVSNIAETSPTLNLTINTRDSIIAADLYDFACDVFGPIGQQKIFDKMTEAIELLANLGPMWDPLIGYVDITTFNSFYVTLPQYVDQVLAINVNHTTGSFRNQWFEFHMNGLGQDNDQADAVGSNRPCGGWEEVGEMPCAFPLLAPSYLVASPVSAADNDVPIRIWGIDTNDLPMYGPDGQPGIPITCEQNVFAITNQPLPFKRIDRIVIQGSPQSFIQLYATDGTKYLQNLGIFWPNVPEPRFRVIKIGQKAVTVRLRYKKRLLKITSLTDPLHMRSRSALMNALRSIETATMDAASAATLLEAAKQLLQREWRATHPQEQLGLQVDPSTWGANFITMPALAAPIFFLPAIERLFPVSGPTHISWLITPVIIYALHRHRFIRRITNCFVECLKRLIPFRAKFDVALLIVANVFRSIGTLCPVLNISPSKVDLRAGHTMSLAVCSGNFPAKTAATPALPAGQAVPANNSLLPAIAGAKPSSELAALSDGTTIGCSGYDGPSIEMLADFGSHNRDNYFEGAHRARR